MPGKRVEPGVTPCAGDLANGLHGSWTPRWRASTLRSVVAVALLGPVEVATRSGPAALTAPMQRAVIAFLALAHGHAATNEQLVAALWHDPPVRAANLVQQYVHALRRALGPEVIVTAGHGYRLSADTEPDAVDVDTFRRLLAQAHARRVDDPAAAARLITRALALHRGEPLEDLPDCPFIEPNRARMNEHLLDAQLLSAALANDLGQYPTALSQAGALAEDHPLDENVVAELMRALVGAGRQTDALAAFDRIRRHLAEEMGLEPGAVLRTAQAAVLNQDPTFTTQVSSASRTGRGWSTRSRTPSLSFSGETSSSPR